MNRLARSAASSPIALALLLSPAAAVAQFRFEPSPPVESIAGAFDPAIADFDGDGWPDAAVTDVAGGAFAILRNSGDGTLAPAGTVTTPAQPTRLLAGDYDGDGNVDLLCAADTNRSVTFLRGNADGTFVPAGTALAPFTGVFVDGVGDADLNGDGTSDLVIAWDLDVAIVLGGFSGDLPTPAGLAIPPAWPIHAVAALDADRDGRLDLAVVTRGSLLGESPAELLVLFGDGTGAFPRRTRSTIAPEVRLVTFVMPHDADEDGDDDLLVGADGVFLAPGNGAGGFAPAVPVIAGPPRDRITRVADFDADGHLDVFTALGQGPCEIFAGDGTGRFEAPAVRLESIPVALRSATGDLDRDGHPDLVVTSARSAGGAVQAFVDRSSGLCLAGSVDRGRSPRAADVLFVNESSGGARRRVVLTPSDAFEIFVTTPPAATGRASFALYAWTPRPGEGGRFALPFRVGFTCLPTPLSSEGPAPRVVWNNTGRAALGTPTLPSSPSPSVVFARPRGLGRAATFLVQGVIADVASAGTRPASVTNGVIVDVR